MAGNKPWGTDELEILKTDYQHSAIEEIVELLPDRSKDAIQWKASQLGLLIRNGKRIKANKKIIANITEEQLQFLNRKRNHSRIVREALDLYMKTVN